ncbi:MAG: hypothetical protein JSW52_09335 [Candidatus Coatesbacteria bacterium]|nr:MAG: hypothetical protein JSW52_09335 [Candidatus Coatesbacteria bacterium]
MRTIAIFILTFGLIGCTKAENNKPAGDVIDEEIGIPDPIIEINFVTTDTNNPPERAVIAASGKIFRNGAETGEIDWDGALPGYCAGTDDEPIYVERYRVDLSVYDDEGDLLGYIEKGIIKTDIGNPIYKISGGELLDQQNRTLVVIGEGRITDKDGEVIANYEGETNAVVIASYLVFFGGVPAL